MTVLAVCSVAAEAAALSDAGCEVLVGGVGPVAAAASTSARLARGGVDLVVCAGIAGAFAPLEPRQVAVASSIVFADLGAETPEGFVPLPSLGFGQVAWQVPASLAVTLADLTGGHMGTVLTVATVTGTATTAETLAERFPDAVAEGMEGAGVAAAATLHGVPFAEVRAISNLVGPRDREAWDVPGALAALGRAVAAIGGWAP